MKRHKILLTVSPVILYKYVCENDSHSHENERGDFESCLMGAAAREFSAFYLMRMIFVINKYERANEQPSSRLGNPTADEGDGCVPGGNLHGRIVFFLFKLARIRL
ncbi:hypothetical protein B5M42_019740 [Paenibacillus athensensis]|uniref:hypothetical protein n=1 Tax=Paenibacillus athensensis TaxID=1967502 RepID=UPI001E4C5427|nr:hypothetical protein [Paenibacillus athensensis]MCD1261040.1 hypothetical protein [Paenibacillus athensensis]